MRLFFSAISLLIFNINFSQNIIIDYNATINTNDAVLATSINYKLIINNNSKTSAYFNDSNDSINQFKYSQFIDEKVNKNGITRVKLSDNHYSYIRNDYFFNDYVKDTLIYNEIISTKKVLVGEKTNIFNWEIQPKSDTLIMNFKCQKATTKFRGRVYEAFFTNQIATYGGPWKFDGLPGLILSIRSLDNYFVISPVKILLNSKEKINIENVYNDKSIVSWSEFKKLFKENMERRLKVLKANSEIGEGGGIKITDKIEDLEIPEMKL